MDTHSGPAAIVRWVDGDTCEVTVSIALPLMQSTIERTHYMRIAHINAPEMATPEGPLAKAHAELLALPGQAWVIIRGLDKYRRWLGDLILEDGGLFSDRMVADGFAVRMMRMEE